METGKPRMSLWRIDTLLVVLLLGFAHPINFDNILTVQVGAPKGSVGWFMFPTLI